jgi:hypothetical protein
MSRHDDTRHAAHPDDPYGEAARCADCGEPATRQCLGPHCAGRALCERCFGVHDPDRAWAARAARSRKRVSA